MLEETALTLACDGFGEGWSMARSGKQQETIGQRLARLRKERAIAQQELADRLGVTQPHVSEWERGGLRLHGELIVEMAGILGVSADELLGLEKITAAGGAAPARRFTRRLQAIAKLPKRDQEALLRTIDAFLTKAS